MEMWTAAGEAWGRGAARMCGRRAMTGVRVTVVRAEGREPVTRPVDLTNKKTENRLLFREGM